MITQGLQEQVDRSLKVTPGSDGDPSAIIADINIAVAAASGFADDASDSADASAASAVAAAASAAEAAASAASIALPLPTTSGGSGASYANAAALFNGIKQVASETATGVVEKLTTAEGNAGLDDTRYHSAATMKAAQIQLGTAVTLTNQTAVDFTGIPSWAKRVTVMFSGVSTNGTSNAILQVGAGSVQTSGYLGAVAFTGSGSTGVNITNGFGVANGLAAASVFHGIATLTRLTGNTWVYGISGGFSSTAAGINGGGAVTLSGTLDRLRFTTAGGTDQADAGSINISYE